MRVTPINPYARLLRDPKYKHQVVKNKRKYDRKRDKNDRLRQNNERNRGGTNAKDG